MVVVREDADLADHIQRACYGTAAVGKAAVVFIWAAVPRRSEWKYGHIAHKMIAIEAGHVCENLYLAGESTHTGVCALLAYHQASIDTLIGADGDAMFAIYLACVGKTESAQDSAVSRDHAAGTE